MGVNLIKKESLDTNEKQILEKNEKITRIVDADEDQTKIDNIDMKDTRS